MEVEGEEGGVIRAIPFCTSSVVSSADVAVGAVLYSSSNSKDLPPRNEPLNSPDNFPPRGGGCGAARGLRSESFDDVEGLGKLLFFSSFHLMLFQ